MDIQHQIRNVISNMVSQQGREENGIGEMEIMEGLRQRGVVDEVMRHIHVDGVQNEKIPTHFRAAEKHISGPMSKKGNKAISYQSLDKASCTTLISFTILLSCANFPAVIHQNSPVYWNVSLTLKGFL